MPKLRKAPRSRQSVRLATVSNEVPLATNDVLTRKANPEELTKAVARATDIFGDEDAAFRWLGTPVAALDYATPISCLSTHQGAIRVNDVLTQIEHGVW